MESEQLLLTIQQNYIQNYQILENIKKQQYLVVNDRSFIRRNSSIINYYVYNIDQYLREQYNQKQIHIDPDPHIIHAIKEFFNQIDGGKTTLYQAYLRSLNSRFNPYEKILQSQAFYQQQLQELEQCLEREQQRQLDANEKYRENQNNIRQLNELLQNNQIQFQNNLAQISQKTQDITEQQNIIEQLEQNINQIKNTIEEIHKQEQKQNQQIKELEEQLGTQQQENIKQKQRLNQLNAEIKKYLSQIENHRNQLWAAIAVKDALESKNQQIQEDIDIIKKKCDEAKSKNQEIQDKIVGNQKVLERLQQEIDRQTAQKKQETEQIGIFTNLWNKLTKKRDETQLQLQNLDAQLKQNELLVTQQEIKIRQGIGDKNKIMEDIEKLQQQLQDLQEQRKQIQEQQAKDDQNVAEQIKQIKNAKYEIRELSKQQLEIQSKIQQSQNKKQELEKQLTDIKNKYQHDRNLMLEKRDVQRKQYKDEISNKSEQLYKQQQYLTQLQTKSSDLDNVNKNLQDKLNQQQVEGSKQISELQQQLQQQESQSKTLIRQLEQTSKQLQDKTRSLQDDIETKQKENILLQNRKREIEGQIKEKLDLIQIKQQQQLQLEANVEEKKGEIEEKKKQNQQLESKLQQLQKKYAENEQQIKELEQKKQQYKEQLTTFTADINKLTNELNEYIETIDKYNLYGEKIQKSIDEVGESIKKMGQIQNVGEYFYKLATGFEYILKVDDSGKISFQKNTDHAEMEDLAKNQKTQEDKKRLNDLISAYLYNQLYEFTKLIHMHIQRGSESVGKLSTWITEQLKDDKKVAEAEAYIKKLKQIQRDMTTIIEDIYGLLFQAGLPGVSENKYENPDQMNREITLKIEQDKSGLKLVNDMLSLNGDNGKRAKKHIQTLLNESPDQFEKKFENIFKKANRTLVDKYRERNQSIQALVSLISGSSQSYNAGLTQFSENVFGKLGQLGHSNNSNILQDVIQRVSENIAKPLANVVRDLKKLEGELRKSQPQREDFTTRNTNNLSSQKNNNQNKFQNQLFVFNSILQMII